MQLCAGTSRSLLMFVMEGVEVGTFLRCCWMNGNTRFTGEGQRNMMVAETVSIVVHVIMSIWEDDDYAEAVHHQGASTACQGPWYSRLVRLECHNDQVTTNQ